MKVEGLLQMLWHTTARSGVTATTAEDVNPNIFFPGPVFPTIPQHSFQFQLTSFSYLCIIVAPSSTVSKQKKNISATIIAPPSNRGREPRASYTNCNTFFHHYHTLPLTWWNQCLDPFPRLGNKINPLRSYHTIVIFAFVSVYCLFRRPLNIIIERKLFVSSRKCLCENVYLPTTILLLVVHANTYTYMKEFFFRLYTPIFSENHCFQSTIYNWVLCIVPCLIKYV